MQVASCSSNEQIGRKVPCKQTPISLQPLIVVFAILSLLSLKIWRRDAYLRSNLTKLCRLAESDGKCMQMLPGT